MKVMRVLLVFMLFMSLFIYHNQAMCQSYNELTLEANKAHDSGVYDNAIILIEKATSEVLEIFGEDSELYAILCNNMGVLYLKTYNTDMAESMFKKSIENELPRRRAAGYPKTKTIVYSYAI